MSSIVFYVVRQRGGWGVEQNGMVRSGHPTRDDAVCTARAKALAAAGQGHQCRVRIQDDGGLWREERSFAPSS